MSVIDKVFSAQFYDFTQPYIHSINSKVYLSSMASYVGIQSNFCPNDAFFLAIFGRFQPKNVHLEEIKP